MSEQKPTLMFKSKRFFKECVRVLKITKKPDADEFKAIVKASGLGISVIGLIGFIIAIFKKSHYWVENLVLLQIPQPFCAAKMTDTRVWVQKRIGNVNGHCAMVF